MRGAGRGRRRAAAHRRLAHVDDSSRRAPGAGPGTTNPLGFSLVLYLIAALGMQLMTFEDMTYELRRTNRRLEGMQ